MKILVVENKTKAGAQLVKALRDAGHQVEWCSGIFHDLYKWEPKYAFHRVNEADLKDGEIIMIDPAQWQVAIVEESLDGSEEGVFGHSLTGPEKGWNIVRKLNRAGVVCIGISRKDEEYCFKRFREDGAVITCNKAQLIESLPTILPEAERLVVDNSNEGDYMRGLTVQQPFAWAVFAAGKDYENRTWPAKIRATVAIHAAQTEPEGAFARSVAFVRKVLWKCANRKRIPASSEFARGAIIGVVDVIDSVDLPWENTHWFEGPLAFQLANPRLLKTPIPCEGKRRFFRLPADVEAQVRAQLAGH
jgi:hypothetical protein